MKLEEILPELRKGRRAKRRSNPINTYIQVKEMLVGSESLLAGDWELEPEKEELEELYQFACRNMSGEWFIDKFLETKERIGLDTNNRIISGPYMLPKIKKEGK